MPWETEEEEAFYILKRLMLPGLATQKSIV
jgi:hypothetical protein